jgi:N6-L-threonylcarbamoyladenine synthase
MQAHVLAHFIDEDGYENQHSFLALTISGGHTQILKLIFLT